MKRINAGLTLVEILMVVLLATLLLTPLYQFLIRGFRYQDAETRNLEAIQEMAFIIYNLRNDLRALIEFEGESDSYAYFNPSSKTLNMTVVNGVTENGVILYSKVLYCFEKNCLIKKFQVLEDRGMSSVYVRKLTAANKLKEFDIKLLGAEGRQLDKTRLPGQKPRYLKARIVHATNSKLEVTINIFSTYIESQLIDEMQKFWLPTWKICTSNLQAVRVMTNNTKAPINMGAVPNSAVTNFGIKIGNNMGTPGGF